MNTTHILSPLAKYLFQGLERRILERAKSKNAALLKEIEKNWPNLLSKEDKNLTKEQLRLISKDMTKYFREKDLSFGEGQQLYKYYLQGQIKTENADVETTGIITLKKKPWNIPYLFWYALGETKSTLKKPKEEFLQRFKEDEQPPSHLIKLQKALFNSELKSFKKDLSTSDKVIMLKNMPRISCMLMNNSDGHLGVAKLVFNEDEISLRICPPAKSTSPSFEYAGIVEQFDESNIFIRLRSKTDDRKGGRVLSINLPHKEGGHERLAGMFLGISSKKPACFRVKLLAVTESLSASFQDFSKLPFVLKFRDAESVSKDSIEKDLALLLYKEGQILIDPNLNRSYQIGNKQINKPDKQVGLEKLKSVFYLLKKKWFSEAIDVLDDSYKLGLNDTTILEELLASKNIETKNSLEKIFYEEVEALKEKIDEEAKNLFLINRKYL